MSSPTYRHSAIVYASRGEFFAAALAFARNGLAGDDAVVIGLLGDGNRAVASALGEQAAAVTFLDLADGAFNPARLMAHHVTLANSAGRPLRVVGDVGWDGHPDSVQAEAILTDALLDSLAARGGPLRMLCGLPAYATSDRQDAFLGCHDGMLGAAGSRPNTRYRPDTAARLFAEPLPEPRTPVSVYCSNGRPLHALRDFVAEHAHAAHLSPARTDDLVLAAHEIATNSLRHAGSEPILRIWRDVLPAATVVVCEIRDHGAISDPMAGRVFPDTNREDGRGLWLAHQLCDLTQVRSSPALGTTVRLHIRS